MTQTEKNKGSFNSWLRDKHNLLEKTAGAVVLIIELMEIIGRLFHKTPEIPLTEILNLVFLLFVYVQLTREFRRRFTLDDPDPKKVAKILRVWRYSDEHRQEKINELVLSSNKLIGQLENIKYFILATSALYALFLLKGFIEGEADKHHVFHILFDVVSYCGAFFLLRCFFVMYLPTIENGREVLREKTKPYIWFGVGLMVLDVCLTIYVQDPPAIETGWFASFLCGVTSVAPDSGRGVFIAEFICGVVNAVVFVLFVARFENKILEIPPYILFLLYSYAVLQTCLPFVTNNGLVFGRDFSEGFSSIVFKLVLVGKVALAAVLFYVLSSGRIFYYFMSLKSINDEEKEERNWENFKKVMIELKRGPDQFEITYAHDKEGRVFTAMVVPTSLFGHLTGTGEDADKAREDLLKKIQSR